MARRLRTWLVALAALLAVAAALSLRALPVSAAGAASGGAVSPGAASRSAAAADAGLARSLPGGFTSATAQVNGVRLHYVTGGRGEPLVLLHGWPQTWWEFHEVMPALARHYRLVVPDLRGAGTSDKPAGGYDKATMAEDVYQLVRSLGYRRTYLAGHDIGGMVAYSFATHHPSAARKVAILDIPVPDSSFYRIPVLPPPGSTAPTWPWWFAFHSVRDLPETLVHGQEATYLSWFYQHLAHDPEAIAPADVAVYARAYAAPGALRAGDAWYQAFGRDIADNARARRLAMPVLVMGGVYSFAALKAQYPAKAAHLTLVAVPRSGHWIVEEQPAFAAARLRSFFG